MRIAVAQARGCAGDFAAAKERVVATVARAAGAGAGLVVFPAYFLAPPEPVCEPDREGFFVDTLQLVSELAGSLAAPTILPVVLGGGEAGSVLEAAYIDGESVVPLRLMGQLRAAARRAGADDGEDAGAGLALPQLEVGGLTLGVAFTHEDLDEYVGYDYRVDAVLFVSTYGFALDDSSSALGASLAESRFVDDADAMNAWVVGVGGVGAFDLEVHAGSSFALAPWGELAAEAPAFEEALMLADIDRGFEGPLREPLQMQVFDPALLAWEAVAEGLRAIAAGLGRTEAAVVVDGTLASMLACAAAVDAVGPTHVRPFVLAWGDARDASSRKLARNLRLEAAELDARSLTGRGAGEALDEELALDAAWARAAAWARSAGGFVVSGADKTALALGSAAPRDLVCVLPFGDLYRSDVLALSRLRNTVSPVVPLAARRAFSADDLPVAPKGPASAEKRLEVVDSLLTGYVEWERPLSDLAEECGDEGLVRAVVAVARKSINELPGRVLAPVLTSKTLEEARGAFGLRWRDRVRTPDERLDLSSLADALRAEGTAGEAGGDGAAAQAPGGSDDERALDALDLLGMLGATSDDGPGPLDALFGEQRPSGPEGGHGRGHGEAGGFFWGGGPFSEN